MFCGGKLQRLSLEKGTLHATIASHGKNASGGMSHC